MEATRSCSQAHLPLQSISFPPQFYKKFQFTVCSFNLNFHSQFSFLFLYLFQYSYQKSKPSNSHPRLVIAKVLGTGDNGDFEHFTATPNKIFMEEVSILVNFSAPIFSICCIHFSIHIYEAELQLK